MSDERPKCRFGCEGAAARFAMSEGCVCWPDDKEQDLCAQHAIHATPIGTMELIKKYVEWPSLFARWEAQP